jgi:hypothetical protein
MFFIYVCTNINASIHTHTAQFHVFYFRFQDTQTQINASSLIGQSEGTLYIEFEVNQGSGNSIYYGFTSGSFANYVVIGKEFPDKITCAIGANSTAILTTLSTIPSGFVKCAIGYKSGELVAYLNGVQVGSSNTVFSFSSLLSVLGVGTDGALSNVTAKMLVKEIRIKKTRLTNAELEALTTL